MERNYEMINGVEVDVTTVMDKTVQYIPTEIETEDVMDDVRELLETYFPHLHDGKGLQKMFGVNGEFWKNKGWLISAFKRHPYYNGNLQIVLKNQDMCRHIDMEKINEFENWVYNTTRKYGIGKMGDKFAHVFDFIANNGAESQFCTQELADSLNIDYKAYQAIKKYYKEGLTYEYIKNTLEAYGEGRRRMLDRFAKENLFDDSWRTTSYFANIFFEQTETEINDHIRNERRLADKGQKISRVIGNIAKLCGLDKIVELKDCSFYSDNGEFHSRIKDMGWNKQFADFADAINPIQLKATVVVSVNPIDYYTMSFGRNWASCHTIDKRNIRGVNNNHYSGCYCGGTESYMLDNSSIIVYYLPEDFDGDYPEQEDKLKRCVFYLGEDKMIQSRVYPDGRDGGEITLAKDMRTLMQKLIAEMFGAPNYWSNKKGTGACAEVIVGEGVQYEDYLHYNDCNVSYMKRIDGHKNTKIVYVGKQPICPECGREHWTEENIFCEDCTEKYVICADCGNRIRESDSTVIDGETYCNNCLCYCDECGCYEREGRYINDDTWVCEYCLQHYYHWSEHDNEYIHIRDVIETEEGNYYGSDSDGYVICCECGEYHDFDSGNIVYDESTGEYYCVDCYEEIMANR